MEREYWIMIIFCVVIFFIIMGVIFSSESDEDESIPSPTITNIIYNNYDDVLYAGYSIIGTNFSSPISYFINGKDGSTEAKYSELISSTELYILFPSSVYGPTMTGSWQIVTDGGFSNVYNYDPVVESPEPSPTITDIYGVASGLGINYTVMGENFSSPYSYSINGSNYGSSSSQLINSNEIFVKFSNIPWIMAGDWQVVTTGGYSNVYVLEE